MARWQPIASMVTMHPCRSSNANSFGDLIRLLLGRFLPEHQPIGVRPGADPVQRMAVLRAIPRATGGFAIHRNHFARGLLPYPLGPTHKATPKTFRGQPGDDIGNTVMGRHAVFQGNESPQPLQLEPGPNSAIPSQPSAPLATAQDGKNQNVHQRMELLALDSG